LPGHVGRVRTARGEGRKAGDRGRVGKPVRRNDADHVDKGQALVQRVDDLDAVAGALRHGDRDLVGHDFANRDVPARLFRWLLRVYLIGRD